MKTVVTTSMSWWIGLDRQRFRAEIAAREPIWRAQKSVFLDFVGLAIRDRWELRHAEQNTRDMLGAR